MKMDKITAAQEFVKAVNPAMQASDIDPKVFIDLSKKKEAGELPTSIESKCEQRTFAYTGNYGINMGTIPNKLPTNRVSFLRTYKVVYLGYAVLDRRYTLPMLPWVIAEIKRYGSQNAESIYIEVADSVLKAVSSETNKLVFEHKLQTISKFAQTSQDPTCFTYMTREVANGPCAYHVFQAADECTVVELFTTMREMTKEMVQLQSVLSSSSLTKCGSGISLESIVTSGQNFEVMYLARIKVMSKRAPPTFIDDAVEKVHVYELEKLRNQQNSGTSSHRRHRHGSGASISSLPYNLDVIESVKENELGSQNGMTPENCNVSCVRNSAENVSAMSSAIVNRALHKSCSDPFSITALTPSSSTDSFITGISPSMCTVPFSQNVETSNCNPKCNTLMPPSSLITHTQSLDTSSCVEIVQDLQGINTSGASIRERAFSTSDSSIRPSQKQTSLPAYRNRAASGGSGDIHRPRAFTNPSSSICSERNRTMLFIIGKFEICLIGMDKKQVLLSKTFNDIAHCSQGIKHLDHFGFICRETAMAGADFYAGYIFRCQTERVVNEIMQSLRLAFKKAHQDYQQTPQPQSPNVPRVVICENCPMQWFHRLCSDIEGLPAEEVHCNILTKMQSLHDADRIEIMSKCEDADVDCLQEQNEVLMMFLREFCEQKQMKHSHLNGASKSDFLFLKEKSGSSKLDNFRQKAKKSLSNSFETILKLKHREEGRDRSLTSISDNSISKASDLLKEELSERSYREGSYDGLDSKRTSSVVHNRPRSSTFSTTREILKASKKRTVQGKNESSPAKSPIMNMFMKISSQHHTPSTNEEEHDTPSRRGSWRQAIFHRIQTPPVPPTDDANGVGSMKNEDTNSCSSLGNTEQSPCRKKTKEQLRALWRKAILEQILLIRMEKENKKLQVSQDAVWHKRMKLDYEDITPCLKETVLEWEKLLDHPDRPHMKVDSDKLHQLVKAGVPRSRRGEIWCFLAEQHNLKNSEFQANSEHFNLPYEELLRQLTSHQHAILIDLGRTFPNHPFYSQPLGPGQLSLFNLLKAYSLLDSEVGYCQGLSFVSGILLLHMPEEQAFQMMKHILFHLGFRRQYKPDMVALQVQMYQLSRLMHDNCREIYGHLETYDIAPTLYAAPWFLTLFASQFPLKFVSRLFDLIFLQGVETIFKVASALISNQRDVVLQCHSFEAMMEFFKGFLPSMNVIEMQRVFNEVITMDISDQLHAYEVEYHVLKEEMMYSPSRNDAENVQKLETANTTMKMQNMELMEQLQVAQSTIHNLEALEASYKSTVQRLEARVRSLEDEKEALQHSINILKKRLQTLEIASYVDEVSDGSNPHPPSFGVVYTLAGSEKEEDRQLKQLMRDFCDKQRENSNQTQQQKGFITDDHEENDWIVIKEENCNSTSNPKKCQNLNICELNYDAKHIEQDSSIAPLDVPEQPKKFHSLNSNVTNRKINTT